MEAIQPTALPAQHYVHTEPAPPPAVWYSSPEDPALEIATRLTESWLEKRGVNPKPEDVVGAWLKFYAMAHEMTSRDRDGGTVT